jgi:zinc D-Ala-D-Ala carboxypeptidase
MKSPFKNKAKISDNFFLYEFERTSHKIDNSADIQSIIKLTYLCAFIMQPLRIFLKKVIKIDSGFRCYAVNIAVKGQSDSQHLTGEACDFICCDLIAAYNYICSNLSYDQCIIYSDLEHNPLFIHVSYRHNNNRKMHFWKLYEP